MIDSCCRGRAGRAAIGGTSMLESQSDPVVVVAGARTAIGSFAKSFRATPAHVLGAAAIQEATSRAGVGPEEVDEVVMGCVGQVGPDAFNARRASLAAGLSVSTPA